MYSMLAVRKMEPLCFPLVTVGINMQKEKAMPNEEKWESGVAEEQEIYFP